MTGSLDDPRALRDAFGAFMTGVTVVTAFGSDGKPLGFTANSFASVSLSPPLLLVCIARTSRNYAAVTAASGFAVNVLAEDQKDVSNTFARPVEDRFAAVDWQSGPAGSPVFDGAAAWFDCAMERVVEAGDHAILLGRVEGFRNSGRNGLGYARGGYFAAALEAQTQGLGQDGSVEAAAVAEQDGRVLLVEDQDGRWALPGVAVAEGNPAEVLAQHLTEICGGPASVGFLFSVFGDRSSKRQHIVYRATIEAGPEPRGRFFAPDELPAEQLSSQQTADILRRFAAERSLGNFGVYVGNESAGQVHPLSLGGSVP
ncbi:MAG: flavin reductase [Bosea sp.]|uniref:flavin reductase n=1 Tax=Bosea sp. (in: a-proteobacteria) TaxID=1871050 RepID=UPI002388E579|nr:flavin reductase [Bosea sp. (in: a-proteobacteria)]MCP4737804.1 flavin reductase [Bosea sp. (in: a-proteobacteria)]